MSETQRPKRGAHADATHTRAGDALVGTICVTGASGFIGWHLWRRLARLGRGPVHCLTRRPAALRGEPQLVVKGGDMRDASALERFLQPGATVFNLAFDRDASLDKHVGIARALAHACDKRSVVRLVHLSTATVVGDNRERLIDERSRCTPVTAYERAKLAIEETLTRALEKTELVIVRPTAVFGPGGRNLVKLASEIASGDPITRHLRACFHGRRPLNLVSVENVVEALVFLAHARLPPGERVYIVSDGEDPANNYRDVERTLAHAFSRRDSVLPVVPIPPMLRDFLLRRAGRGETNSERRFCAERLAALGYVRPVTFESAISAYAKYLAAQFGRGGKITG
jgi:nucleoside-diphosphate-sugar epimerase